MGTREGFFTHQEAKRRSRRRRGDHATAPLCPAPQYSRPATFKNLPGELGRTFRNLYNSDRQLKRHISRHPKMIRQHNAAGRKRDFRPEVRPLYDELAPLILSYVNIADLMVAADVTTLAGALSPRDENGRIIKGQQVTVPRMSRALHELSRHGVINLGELHYDHDSKTRLPRYINVNLEFFELCGADMTRIIQQHELALEQHEQRQQMIIEGLIGPDERISLKAAQRRQYKRLIHDALKRRRAKAADQKRRRRLASIDTEEDRRHAVALWIEQAIKRGQLVEMSADEKQRLIIRECHEIRRLIEYRPPPVDIPAAELPF